MGKRIHNAASSAWARFRQIDRQVARTASRFADTTFDDPRSLGSMRDYSALKAYADSGARSAGY